MTLLDFAVGFLLLPAAVLDTLTQPPVGFQSERIAINGREFVLYNARTPEQWQQGFKDKRVAPNEVMLFEFPSDGWKMFWMKGTVTPLDIVFLDTDFRVLKVYENAQPCRFLCKPYIARGRYVLEFRAGVVKELAIFKGQTIGMPKS